MAQPFYVATLSKSRKSVMVSSIPRLRGCIAHKYDEHCLFWNMEFLCMVKYEILVFEFDFNNNLIWNFVSIRGETPAVVKKWKSLVWW